MSEEVVQAVQLPSFNVYGGDWTSSPFSTGNAGHLPYDSVTDLQFSEFNIDGYGSALFVVSLGISYSFAKGDGNPYDTVTLDFADDRYGYSVGCPYVQLRLLTAPVGSTENSQVMPL